MNESLYFYMKLGINHHLLNFRCFEDSNYHLQTLPFLLDHPAFQVIDLFITDHKKIREKEIVLVKNSGKEIVYNGGIILLDRRYDIRSRRNREKLLQILKNEADLAIEVNASKFVIVSSFDPGEEERQQAKEDFSQFLYDFSRYVSDSSYMKVVLEPSDRNVDKKMLLGPTEEAVEVIERTRSKGVTNLGLMIDMSHLPLLKEPFEQAVTTCGNLLWHVHLGNCILRDRNHPWYGDKHPPVGFPSGEHGVKELASFLRLLLKYGYLTKTEKNSASIEVRSFPDKTAEETVSQQLELLHKAWEQIPRA